MYLDPQNWSCPMIPLSDISKSWIRIQIKCFWIHKTGRVPWFHFPICQNPGSGSKFNVFGSTKLVMSHDSPFPILSTWPMVLYHDPFPVRVPHVLSPMILFPEAVCTGCHNLSPGSISGASVGFILLLLTAADLEKYKPHTAIPLLFLSTLLECSLFLTESNT